MRRRATSSSWPGWNARCSATTYSGATGPAFNPSLSRWPLSTAGASYSLTVRAPGFIQYAELINVSANITGKTISLVSGGFTISGIVTDNATSAPITGAKVSLRDPVLAIGYGAGNLGADGFYSITVASGNYTLTVRATGYAQYAENIVMSANITGKNIALTTGYTVSGVVKYSDTMEFAAGASVLLVDVARNLEYKGPNVGLDGTYSMTVAPGSYQLKISATGYALYQEDLSITADIPNKDITLTT